MRSLNTALVAAGALVLAACGGSGSVPVTPSPPPPTASLSAMPTSVSSGGSVTLTWNSTNATACTASGGWSGPKGTSGTQSSGTLSTSAAFSLTCSGSGGTAAPATTTVNIIPTAILIANPAAIPSGSASTLSWSSTQATACTGSGVAGWTGAKGISGTYPTGALTANATYSLSCTGAGGPSIVATATVTISNGTVTMSPGTAGLAVSQTQQFTATVPGGGAATWQVDGVSGGNATVGTVSSAGLYTAGSAVGRHTILATSVANSSQSGAAVAAVTDLTGVYTYHNDAGRSGANTKEYALTPATVTGGKFGKLAACSVDGAIYAQPLWVANLTVAGVKHNVIFVATQHDSLYAFDADASPCAAPLWQVSLVATDHGANGGETSVPTVNLSQALVGGGNGDIQPEIGVTSTPVIDPANGILYVLAKSVNAGHTTFYQRLHAIDLATGLEKTGSPVLIAGTYPGIGDGGTTVTFDPRQEGQRPGLALLNNTVYIAWASHGDWTPFYGWMMGYTYNGSAFAQSAIFNTAPNSPYPSATGGAGIWMCGSAPASDSFGNLYVLTGNGIFDATNGSGPTNDYGDSMLQLNGALQVQTYFTPSDQATDYMNDSDFGAGGAAVLADLPAGSPKPHLVVGGGKDTHFYVLNRDNLGGSGDSNAIQPSIYAGGAIKGSGALWNNFFYISGDGGPLYAFSITPTAAQPFPTNPTWMSTNLFFEGGGTASISASGNSNGIAWVLDNANYCTGGDPATKCSPAVLYAYDATNVGTMLWNSSSAVGDQAGNPVKFTIPTIANGKVYVGTRGNNIGGAAGSTSVAGELDIYGLKP